MKATWRKGAAVARVFGKASFALLMFTFALLVVGTATGARLNVTKSLPPGLYWAVDRPIERYAYVRFCPPSKGAFAVAIERSYLSDSGACPGGSPMIKRVAGVAGDSVDATEAGVSINGHRLPLSAFHRTDGLGRPMPQPDRGERRLHDSELWVMSDTNDRSFDSRYFGPIDRAWVREVIVPVLTWGPGGTLADGI